MNRSRYLGFGGEMPVEPSSCRFLRSYSPDSWSTTACQVKRSHERKRSRVVHHQFKNFQCVRFTIYFGELLAHLITLDKVLKSRSPENVEPCWFKLTLGWWSWKLKSANECVTIDVLNDMALKWRACMWSTLNQGVCTRR